MPILDLNGAKPIEGTKPRGRRRTLGDPGTLPPGAVPYGVGGGLGRPAASIVNRLTGDFLGANISADQELFGSTLRLRARARQLAMDNAIFHKFLAEMVQNVVGEHGIQLQSKVTNDYGRQTAETKRINLRIEQEWKRWGKLGSCTADGGSSWVDLQQLAIRTCAAEGEFLLKQVLGPQFNESAFALQPLDNDQLDDSMLLAAQGPDGNEVRMGVEVNAYGRPQAYHCFSGHPSDMQGRNRQRVRIPAQYVTHLFLQRRPSQRRGYTWGSAAILELNHLHRYVEAVEVAARFAAAKIFTIESDAVRLGPTAPPASPCPHPRSPTMADRKLGTLLITTDGTSTNWFSVDEKGDAGPVKVGSLEECQRAVEEVVRSMQQRNATEPAPQTLAERWREFLR